MKKHIKQIALFSIVTAALIAVPAVCRAQDMAAGKPAGQTTPTPKKHSHHLPFRGKAVAVDTGAMKLTVGSRTFHVTSETRIEKAGKPATLSDIAVGDKITGSYTKDSTGKLNASFIRDHKGPKEEKK